MDVAVIGFKVCTRRRNQNVFKSRRPWNSPRVPMVTNVAPGLLLCGHKIPPRQCSCLTTAGGRCHRPSCKGGWSPERVCGLRTSRTSAGPRPGALPTGAFTVLPGDPPRSFLVGEKRTQGRPAATVTFLSPSASLPNSEGLRGRPACFPEAQSHGRGGLYQAQGSRLQAQRRRSTIP